MIGDEEDKEELNWKIKISMNKINVDLYEMEKLFIPVDFLLK